jgi:hypothetical protein
LQNQFLSNSRSRELNEPEEGCDEFVVASTEPTMTFDSAPKIFDPMPTTVESARERSGAATFLAPRNAGEAIEMLDTGAHSIGVETFVGNKRAPTQQIGMFVHGADVIARPGMYAERDGSAVAIDHRQNFGFKSTISAANRLEGLAASGIGSILMQLDMGGISKASCRAPRPQPQKEADPTLRSRSIGATACILQTNCQIDSPSPAMKFRFSRHAPSLPP